MADYSGSDEGEEYANNSDIEFTSDHPETVDGLYAHDDLVARNEALNLAKMQGGVFLDPDRGAVWRAGLNHVLSRVHPSSMGPNFSFHISAIRVLASVADDLVSMLYPDMVIGAKAGKRALFLVEDVAFAVRATFPGELRKHALSELKKAVNRVDNGDDPKLMVDIQVVTTVLESQELLAPMYEPRMPIALAATIDYMLAEIIELTGNVVRNRKAAKIKPSDIYQAIHNDVELHKLFRSTIIPDGGVIPNIHAVLLPRK